MTWKLLFYSVKYTPLLFVINVSCFCGTAQISSCFVQTCHIKIATIFWTTNELDWNSTLFLYLTFCLTLSHCPCRSVRSWWHWWRSHCPSCFPPSWLHCGRRCPLPITLMPHITVAFHWNGLLLSYLTACNLPTCQETPV